MARFRYMVEVRRGAEPLAWSPASLAPCLEHALFRSVLEGRLANDGRMPPVEVTPRWEPGGPPRVAQLRLSVEEADAGTYGPEVFAPQAVPLLRGLLSGASARSRSMLDWGLVAHDSRQESPRLRAVVGRVPFPLREAQLEDLSRGSRRVEVEGSLLDELRERMRVSGAVESAGLLLGFLFHDRQRGALLLRVTGQVPLAPGAAGASGAHFALGPDSFALAQQEVRTRDDGSVPVGWWHSHPPCSACAMNPACTRETVFFSQEDREVHTAAFPSAYTVGLVIGKRRNHPATRPGVGLYGWRDARIQRLPLRVVGAETERWGEETPWQEEEAKR